jgi:hypothetical protein
MRSIAAADGHYVAMPPDATRFIKAANAGLPDSAPSTADLLKLMKPFMGHSDQDSIKRLNHLQTRLDHLNAKFGPDAFSRLVRALFGP